MRAGESWARGDKSDQQTHLAIEVAREPKICDLSSEIAIQKDVPSGNVAVDAANLFQKREPSAGVDAELEDVGVAHRDDVEGLPPLLPEVPPQIAVLHQLGHNPHRESLLDAHPENLHNLQGGTCVCGGG